ncbi:RNA polymerase sigma factor [Subtercola lobariae]|uniref:RNA polymerase sigma factor n=1 Tax=Subtercola lobariae TaxID=1588641 RepID=UPI001E50ED7B|nr:RNA polymerase sigma factor [Subtercola lobariae]
MAKPGLVVRVPLAEADDRTLAGRASDGDVRAFEVLIRRHGPLVRGYAARLMGSTDEVDDVVQAAFITAWQQLPTLSDPAAVKGWLLRVANRKALDRIRARKYHDDIDDESRPPLVTPDSTSPEALAEHHAVQSALSRALTELPELQRQCWLMKEVAGYSYDEIGTDLGLPTSTVRGLLSRARTSVIARMEPWR